jgi:short-subunit dehydrogenase
MLAFRLIASFFRLEGGFCAQLYVPTAIQREDQRFSEPAMTHRLAVITGASSGIGRELALLCADAHYHLLIVADEPQIHEVAADLRTRGAEIASVEADLSSAEGVQRLCDAIGDRNVDVLIANAGVGLGHGFLDQTVDDFTRLLNTNINGTLLLVHRIGRRMRARGDGRIMIVGSIAGFLPGSFEAAYSASKAFINSFCLALSEELRGTGVSVTCLMPGVTESNYFRRAGLLNTKVGRSQKDSAAMVARAGFDAMTRRRVRIISGWMNNVRVGLMHFLPAQFLSRQHRRWAEPDPD